MGGTIGFFVAVGIVSSIIFALTMRGDRVRDRRRAYADSSVSDSGGTSSGIGGFSLGNWFGASSSADSCSSSSSSSDSDGSCGDGGGGSDSGGGGGGD